MADQISQADQRKYRNFRDQHGDVYGACIEIRTSHPTGPITPRNSAPLPVPPKYLKPHPTNDTMLVIDYVQWVDDLLESHEAWEEQLRQWALEMYGGAFAEKIEDPPAALLARVGPRPLATEVVLARKAGNPWLRGVPGAEMPAQAKAHFPEPKAPKQVSWGGEPSDDGTFEFPVRVGSAFCCSDGRKFKTEEEAKSHQAELTPAGWAS